MATMAKAGYYKGKIINYGIRKTKAGDPAPVIMFETVEEKHRVFWEGSFKEGARKITLKALATCGFSNINGFPYLADGINSGLLDTSKELDITVEIQKNEDGTEYAKVKWINEPNSSKWKTAISTQETMVLMSHMGLENDFIAIAKENGYTVKSDSVQGQSSKDSSSNGNFGEVESEDLPF